MGDLLEETGLEPITLLLECPHHDVIHSGRQAGIQFGGAPKLTETAMPR